MTAVQSVILLMSLGNVLVIQIIRQSPQLRSAVDLFIVNTSIADLFIPVFSIPYVLKGMHSGKVWLDGNLGTILCKLVPFAMDVSTTVSIFCMLAIAVERFHCVSSSKLFSPPKTKCCNRINALIWFVAIFCHSPYLIGYDIFQRKSPDVLCLNAWYPGNKAFRIYHMTLTICVIIVPMVAITTLYITIIIFLHRQKSKIFGYLGSRGRRRRKKENHQTTFMLILLITIFLIAYIPYSVVITMDFFNLLNVKKYCEILLIFLSVFYSPSAISPIIYFKFNKRYRCRLKRLLRCSMSFEKARSFIELQRNSVRALYERGSDHYKSDEEMKKNSAKKNPQKIMKNTTKRKN